MLCGLGEKITDKGIGNGISLLNYGGIIATLPSSFAQEFASRVSENNGGLMMILIEMILWVVVILLSVLLVMAVRQIPVQYARRTAGGSNQICCSWSKTIHSFKIKCIGCYANHLCSSINVCSGLLAGILMGERSSRSMDAS